eukprot:13577444-Ditylum_brightwellii.AAC.1
MLGAITNWQKDESAVEKAEKYLVTQHGQRRLRKTAQGWKLQVLWNDVSMAWIPLKGLKESHPVEVAEFAKAQGIEDEPAFAWWMPYTLKK